MVIEWLKNLVQLQLSRNQKIHLLTSIYSQLCFISKILIRRARCCSIMMYDEENLKTVV